ncbi:MAG: hypothetical protein LAN84_16415 [Acidobacteriia bacterium]|nr:hypothetical protein [Terriglobia bacterium]
MNGIPTQRKAAAWVALVFLLGGGLGVVAGISVGRHGTAAAASADMREARRAQIVERFNQELQLSAAQRASLEVISKDMQAEFKALHEQIKPQMNEVREKAHSRIREILTPEQKPKFEELLKRLDEERKRRGY